MNRRQAKKNIKRKWKIETYTFPYEPKKVDNVYSYIAHELIRRVSKKLDMILLYGADMRGDNNDNKQKQ